MILRWLTGIVFALIAFTALWFGGTGWFVFLSLCLIIAGVEWANLAGHPRVLISVVIFLSLIFIITEKFYVLPVLLLLPALRMLASQEPDFSKLITWSAAGMIWLALPVGLLYSLRIQTEGFFLVLVLIIATIAQDTMALYGGMLFGGEPTFSPGLSPRKTWAGFITGLLGGLAVFLLASYYVFFPLWISLLLGVCLGVSGSCGDLMFSGLKRCSQLDDTGKIFPGHGGLLDRVDALLINTAVYYTILSGAGLI